MSSAVQTAPRAASPAAPAEAARPRRPDRRALLDAAAPTLFVAANALAFWFVRPGVNDLWAARARASAVTHGVGLFYWFSWFGGGSTPGNYSVVSPFLCSWIGTETVGALSAVACAALITRAVRGTAHPQLAAAVGAVGVAVNLWSGRVPFLLGGAFAVGAVITLVQRRRAATVGLTLLAVLASPVAAAFLVLGASGTFLTTRTREWRPIIAWAAGAAAIAGLADTLIFGAPGPEPFALWLVLEVLGGLAVLLLARPPDHVRTTIYVSLLVTVCVAVVPNGLGSNVARYAWTCLPVLVAALSTARRRRVVLMGVVPLLLCGLGSTVNDLVNADQPIASDAYYAPLRHELRGLPDLRNHRVEVVNHGAHAAYDALLGTASLARGWETQEDTALNGVLNQSPLHAVTYKVWLDNNAVGWVAMPSSTFGATVSPYPEYTLVSQHRPGYLHEYWHDRHWTLFRVSDPNPIVAPPASLQRLTQSSMVVRVPCACRVPVRLRWSRYLDATLRQNASPLDSVPVVSRPQVEASVADDGTGWTLLTTPRAGTYVLHGSARNLLH